jgi:hypothetical protein
MKERKSENFDFIGCLSEVLGYVILLLGDYRLSWIA